ncbi:excisionase family DNA-binding protein [uncultured Maricaulis sp.]|uniref:excisionase family DNA-binding protein n=1 Tax=uncultured Maricaulis sp. TaxID=174710 RepID=UPI002618C067|nr:excisionase family DNA-binding protein [uncultured Maricaulis sp.]
MPDKAKRAAYSVLDAAQYLGVSRSQVYRLLADGSLDSLKIGSRRLIRRDAMDALLERSVAPSQS